MLPLPECCTEQRADRLGYTAIQLQKQQERGWLQRMQANNGRVRQLVVLSMWMCRLAPAA